MEITYKMLKVATCCDQFVGGLQLPPFVNGGKLPLSISATACGKTKKKKDLNGGMDSSILTVRAAAIWETSHKTPLY